MWREFFKPIMWHSNHSNRFRRSNENRSIGLYVMQLYVTNYWFVCNVVVCH